MTLKSLLRLGACLCFALLIGIVISTTRGFVEGNDSKGNNKTDSTSVPSLADTVNGRAEFDSAQNPASAPATSHHSAIVGQRFFTRQGSAAAAPAQAPSGEKTVDQTEKNIQVLKGMPASQLIPVMNFMNASLGVNCNFCHVGEQGKFEFEKDDKEAKGAARKMIQMTMDINKQSFRGRRTITCYSCHRGKESPVAIPALPVSEAAGTEGPRPPRQAMPPVEQVVTKFVAAIGGQAALEKQKTRVIKGVQVAGDGSSIPVEVYQSAPDKYELIVKTPRNGDFITVFDGTGGWFQSQRGQDAVLGDQLDLLKRAANFYAPLKLAELYPRMRVVGRDKIGDHMAYVVVSQPSEHISTRMYFDTESGLLLRVVNSVDTPIARIPQQTDFEDYRDVDGVKIPFTIRQTNLDAHSSYVRKFSEVKANVPVADSTFAKPASKP
ncbi:MAG: photosynthetic reaction center cytochrome c subunit [Blastocatellia bacterium]|nr:photosynthetic reaction center cytochrome c subunit [Blastocatellia bacterium]